MEENNTAKKEGPILTYLHGLTGKEPDNSKDKGNKKEVAPAAETPTVTAPVDTVSAAAAPTVDTSTAAAPAAAPAAADAGTAAPPEKKKVPVRYVNVPLSIDMHRRLNAIKYDYPGERLATLGARAIEEFVARMEEKKKREQQEGK